MVPGGAADPPMAGPTLLAVVTVAETDATNPAATERVGVLGGTFDPVHIGHLMVALEVRHALRLDTMLLVVANDPWQKSATAPVSPAGARLALVRAAVAEINARIGAAALEVSEIEIDRGGPSSTADTLEELARQRPGAALFLLVGSDAAAGLTTWMRPEVVRDAATTVVVERGGREGGRPPADWPHVVVDVPVMDVSSTDIRSRFHDGRPVEALVPAAVVDEIRRLDLYPGVPSRSGGRR